MDTHDNVFGLRNLDKRMIGMLVVGNTFEGYKAFRKKKRIV